ncbi:MAG: hypothetical protein JO099_11025 [Acidobacteriia bacterium]|nr:hypothetical protein [Terriglobia bacterium]
MTATVERLRATILEWPGVIPQPRWEIYRRVIDEALDRNIPFALGGAFALAAHTGRWRDTKDLDLYVLPEFRERMIAAVTYCGLTDYYDHVPYDRWWIYRATADSTIVDIIWATANHRAEIDELWMSGPEVEIDSRKLRVLPAEAMIWDKLFILQRERCDWQDVMNLLYSAGPDVDWKYVTARMGDDLPLLAAALSVFRWLAPGRARALPDWLWQRLGMAIPPGSVADVDRRRVSLLDTRPWFGDDGHCRERAKEEVQC